MRVDVGGGGESTVSKPDLNLLHRDLHYNEHRTRIQGFSVADKEKQ